MDQGGILKGGTRASASLHGAGDDTHDRILKVLLKYVSEGSARAALSRANQSTVVNGRALGARDLPAFFASIERCTAAFLDRKTQALLRGELEFELAISLGRPLVANLASESITVSGEWDVTAARTRARELITALGGKSYDAVKVMTLVSELARNIVLYTTGGQIAFKPCDNPRSLVVLAADEGPGIPNLDEIFAGRYRSKTGLGKGLTGAKRLSDRFEIRTNSNGTRIEAEVRF